jgi:hypothetical protein
LMRRRLGIDGFNVRLLRKLSALHFNLDFTPFRLDEVHPM